MASPVMGTEFFLEIKKKYAGIVYKRRITAAVQDAVGLLAQDLPVRAAGRRSARRSPNFRPATGRSPGSFLPMTARPSPARRIPACGSPLIRTSAGGRQSRTYA